MLQRITGNGFVAFRTMVKSSTLVPMACLYFSAVNSFLISGVNRLVFEMGYIEQTTIQFNKTTVQKIFFS